MPESSSTVTPLPPAIVAVSGGADSLLALALLARQGQALAAVHGRLHHTDPARREREARLHEICHRLGVPFLSIDLAQEFETLVKAPFVDTYLAGHTPNPCALCNPRIKFGLLFQKALERLSRDEAGFATGHYARVEHHPAWGAMLGRGADPAKDQSYFLGLLPKGALPRLHFPLAGLRKRDVPEMLAAMGLRAPDSGESQEVCFIPDNDYRAFIEQSATARGLPLPGPGPARLPDGQTVGTHQGLWRYTQGQRRGLNISWKHPLYVLDKDVASNTLIVGAREDRRATGCLLRDVVFHAPLEQWPGTVLAQVRYRQKARPVRAAWENAGLRLTFSDPEAEAADGPPAPGQLGVCYSEDGLVLAGGLIAREPLAG